MPGPDLRFPILASLAAALVATGCEHRTEPRPGPTPTAAPSALPAAETGSAILRGVIKLEGDPGAPEPWGGAGDVECRSLHPETIQLIKAKDGKLEDVFVHVKAGLPRGSYPTPEAPVVLDQRACEFSPRVFGLRAGQPLAIGNADRLMHNVKSPEFNLAFPFGTKRAVKLSEPGVMTPLKCDVHPWMRAWVGVMDHPYFAVTREDGAFEIRGLPDGEYTVEAWHEKLGKQEVRARAPGAPVEMTFKRK